MTIVLSAILTSLIEKAACDNGFDQQSPREGGWLAFASTQCPLRTWITASDDRTFAVAFSNANVARALHERGIPMSGPLPSGARGSCAVMNMAALHRLLHRAFQLGKSLPDELLHTFERQTASLPRSTEAERLVVQRVGQNLFRQGLLDYWDGRCAITGLNVPQLLRASHIKPWADCCTDAERLDVFNGLLLTAHFDAAFDAGFITVHDDGTVVVSPSLCEDHRNLLGLDRPRKVTWLADGHRLYLPWHREWIFRKYSSE